MSFIGGDQSIRTIEVQATTAGYRVAGTIRTRFDRIALILNSLDQSHLELEGATIRELDADADPWAAPSAIMPLDEILFLAAALPRVSSMDAIVVPKRPFVATIGLPPFRLTGTMYAPESVESPVNVMTVNADPFIVMTDASARCPAHPALEATYPVVAFQRRRVHVFSIGAAAPADSAAEDPRHNLDWG